MNQTEIAHEIATARRTGVQAELGWIPRSMDQAMALQEQVIDSYGEQIAGWKAGATNNAAQTAMGLEGPFLGPIPASAVFGDGTVLLKRDTVMAVEPEIAFRMARDLPLGSGEFTTEHVLDAVGSCHLALEVIGRCVSSPDWQNGIGLTIDFAGNSALVLGQEIDNWRDLDLASITVAALADGKVDQQGSTANVMGSPVTSLVWLANTLSIYGKTLKAGDLVSTGTCTQPVPAVAGRTVSAQFDGIGEVSVLFN